MIKERERFEIYFIKIVVGVNIFGQIISVFRAAAIYNTSYISNILRAVLLVVFGIWFITNVRFQHLAMDIWDAVFLGIPLMATVYGICYGGFGSYVLSDLFNAVGFWLIFYCYKKRVIVIDRQLWNWIANAEVIGVLISFVIYKVFPLLGYPIYSVGKSSNFLLLPLAIYLANGDVRWILVSLMVIYSGKRGVILAAGCMLVYYFLFSKEIKRTIKCVGVGMVLMLGIMVVWFTYSPERIASAPEALRGVLARTMKINPMSPYKDYYSDGRLDEVVSAWESIKENPLRLVTGNGNGFTYEYWHNGKIFQEARHNVHISPINFLTKYGIIYTVFFYGNILLVLWRGTKAFLYREEDRGILIMTLYIWGTFVDSFTVCILHMDYQYIIFLGILNGILLKQKEIIPRCHQVESNHQKN